MILEKNHNPKNNTKLIRELGGVKVHNRELVEEMNTLFNHIRQYEVPLNTKNSRWGNLFSDFQLTLRKMVHTRPAFEDMVEFETIVDKHGNVYPEWIDTLNDEYNHLLEEIDREVNIEDFGAIGDGKTDCTDAFQKAIGKGHVKIFVPQGVFLTKEIRLPSWVCLIGAGKGKTTLKLADSAPKGSRLITNRNHRTGNRNIFIKGMSLNWNVERLGNVEKTSTWGNHSSCLLFANVKFGWVKDVEAINPGLHCFDVSSTLYNYLGDGYRARGGSEFIWLDQLNGYGFGDDGITTHHSDNIFISNSHMCDPSGKAHKKGFSNSNGIEIDDGSRNVWLWNNSTARCFGGVEIKAHHTSSAANHVCIIGHISVNDNRSYNFRHIGHHKEQDPESKTAINIRAANLVSMHPIETHLYESSTPRAMVVSAYKNVAVSHFTAIGDPKYDYKGEPVIAVQYRSRNIAFAHLRIKDFTTAGHDIKVFGGGNHADHVQISDMAVQNSAQKPIHIGTGVTEATIEKIFAERNGGKTIVETGNDRIRLSNINGSGFEDPISYLNQKNRL